MLKNRVNPCYFQTAKKSYRKQEKNKKIKLKKWEKN